ncbi:MAG: GTPase [Planctomycetota bacterium]|nr:GTPase [Planctomycetota bacterium]
MDVSDTIIAISSPPGRSRRTLLRLSGPDAFGLLGLSDPPRGCSRHEVELPEGRLPVVALVARGPASFTGDDLVELVVPGSRCLVDLLQRRLHDRAASTGARLRDAGPGEFTARAFFNGRIDLLQAEGIAELIRAETDAQLTAARDLADGALGRLASELLAELIRLTALVEAGIDFTDQEDVVAIEPVDLLVALRGIASSLDRVLADAISIESLASVPTVVLAGPPNAGKSSLFNRLLGRERTVVADLAGTTRDVLREPLALALSDGVLEVMLVDVAGLDEVEQHLPASTIEASMRRAALQAIHVADLVVRCTPPGEPPSGLPGVPDARILEVSTKDDLPAREPRTPGAMRLSARTGSGLDRLRTAIATALGASPNVPASGRLVLGSRHDSALRGCRRRVGALVDMLEASLSAPSELVAAELRSAIDEIGLLQGRVTPDDILEHVFASFCVGK